MTNLRNCETSNQLMTPPGALDRACIVCLMHDNHHVNLQESKLNYAEGKFIAGKFSVQVILKVIPKYS